MKYYKLLFFVSLFVFSAFSHPKGKSVRMEKLWVFEGYNLQDKSNLYRSDKKFSRDRHGVQFSSNGKLRVHQNESWCATPPIIFETVKGTWKFVSDSVIVVNYPRWGNWQTEEWQILKLTETELEIKRILQ
ncbi:MAG: hypothetical protein U0Y08_03695 [Bacteroidia bacterium]